MPDTKTKTNRQVIPPFGIEIDTPKNSDATIRGIPGCRLRGSVRARATARTIPLCPEIPGQQLHVNPSELRYKIVDPLTDEKNAELRGQIRRTLKQAEESGLDLGGNFDDTIHGVPDQEGELDADEMKTLCREMLSFVESGDARVVAGPRPTLEDVHDLPGEYILDSGTTVGGYSRPKYEKDLPQWKQRMAASGM
jgi:hypothetical protein